MVTGEVKSIQMQNSRVEHVFLRQALSLSLSAEKYGLRHWLLVRAIETSSAAGALIVLEIFSELWWANGPIYTYSYRPTYYPDAYLSHNQMTQPPGANRHPGTIT